MQIAATGAAVRVKLRRLPPGLARLCNDRIALNMRLAKPDVQLRTTTSKRRLESQIHFSLEPLSLPIWTDRHCDKSCQKSFRLAPKKSLSVKAPVSIYSEMDLQKYPLLELSFNNFPLKSESPPGRASTWRSQRQRLKLSVYMVCMGECRV